MDAHESLAERRIREAIERGEFEDLPGRGAPIPGIDRETDPGWWARAWIERDRARTAVHDVAASVERELGSVWLLPDERSVRAAVADLNRRLEATGGSVPVDERPPPVDPGWAVEVWRRMATARRTRRGSRAAGS